MCEQGGMKSFLLGVRYVISNNNNNNSNNNNNNKQHLYRLNYKHLYRLNYKQRNGRRNYY